MVHNQINAPIAQLVERLPFKEMVPGSSPGGRTQVKQKDYSFRNSLFVLETELLQFRACVRDGDMFYFLPENKTVESGLEVVRSVSELQA